MSKLFVKTKFIDFSFTLRSTLYYQTNDEAATSVRKSREKFTERANESWKFCNIVTRSMCWNRLNIKIFSARVDFECDVCVYRAWTKYSERYLKFKCLIILLYEVFLMSVTRCLDIFLMVKKKTKKFFLFISLLEICTHYREKEKNIVQYVQLYELEACEFNEICICNFFKPQNYTYFFISENSTLLRFGEGETKSCFRPFTDNSLQQRRTFNKFLIFFFLFCFCFYIAVQCTHERDGRRRRESRNYFPSFDLMCGRRWCERRKSEESVEGMIWAEI